MAKANPKKWFPSPYMASITLRKVGKYDEIRRAYHPYFDTWEEAHAQATAWAANAVTQANKAADAAQRAIKASEVRVKKVAALKPPHTETP